jgi:hypothetical protein
MRKVPTLASAVAIAASSVTTEVIALGHRYGFIEHKAATFDLRAVERLNSGLRPVARRQVEKNRFMDPAVAWARVAGGAAKRKTAYPVFKTLMTSKSTDVFARAPQSRARPKVFQHIFFIFWVPEVAEMAAVWIKLHLVA